MILFLISKNDNFRDKDFSLVFLNEKITSAEQYFRIKKSLISFSLSNFGFLELNDSFFNRFWGFLILIIAQAFRDIP
jgi:hypothetical protein